MENEIMIHDEELLKSKIHIIRSVQVMLDFDLAAIYGYETRYFNRQVQNNRERFDDDFMFQLTEPEFKEILMCKNFTSSCGGSSKDGGSRTMSISQVEDIALYTRIVTDLQKNPALVL